MPVANARGQPLTAERHADSGVSSSELAAVSSSELAAVPLQHHGASLHSDPASPPTAPERTGEPTVSSNAMVLNLVTGGLGTGMLSLPWAMAGASIVVGVVTIMLVIAVNLWTINILVHAAEKFQVFDLAAVLGHLPGRMGPAMQIFTNVMVWVTLLGSLISYIIGMCDSARPFIAGTFLEQRWALAGLATLIVLPLCFLDQKYLSFSSGAAIVVNMYLLLLVLTEFAQRASHDTLPAGICAVGFTKGSVTMVSTMMQCVIIQMCVLPMYKELEDRSPKKFGRVLLVAFLILALLFIVLSMAGYAAFGPYVPSNLLLAVPKSVAGDVVQIGMFLVLAAVYPIMMIAMVAPVKNLEVEKFGIGPGSARKKSIAVAASTMIFVAVSFFVALVVDSLGLVNVIDGSLCVGVFTALVPGLVGLVLLDRQSATWKAAMAALIGGGTAMSLAGFVFTDNDPDLLLGACQLPSPSTGMEGLSQYGWFFSS